MYYSYMGGGGGVEHFQQHFFQIDFLVVSKKGSQYSKIQYF